MRHALDPLFHPRSVALVGASAHRGKMGHIALRNLSRGKFRLYPVNPGEKRILGLRCYSSITDLPEVVDLAVISLPAEASIQPLRECVRSRVPVAIVTSSGFREAGSRGAELESQLAKTLEGGATRLLGPNTMGVFAPATGLDTFFIPVERSRRPSKGSLALVAQSGAVSIAFMEKARSAGVGMYACVGLGNKLDLNENDMIEYLSGQEHAGCIAFYLESFSDGRRFLQTSKKIAQKKPIVVLKSGRTPAGVNAATSHTGALASMDGVVDGVLRQAGAVRVYDEEELLDVAKALDYVDHIRGKRVCVVASAGGFGVIAADYVESASHGVGLKMASLSRRSQTQLRKVVPGFSSIANPVDLTAGVTDEMYDRVLGILKRDEGVDCVLMSLELQPPNVSHRLVRIAEKRARQRGAPIVVSVFAGEDTAAVLKEFAARGIAAYPSIWRAVRAIGALAERGSRLDNLK